MGNAQPKIGTSPAGNPMHYSVGAVVRRDGKYLLVDRVKIPFGWAGPAGHVDEGEETEEALLREVDEECGLRVVGTPRLICEEVAVNSCSKGVTMHHWSLYDVEVEEGEPKLEEGGAKGIGWFDPEQIAGLQLEPIWEYWFGKIGVIQAS